VAERKPFLLRIDPAVLEGVQRWANDDLRSLNAQIEYLLRESLRKAGRASRPAASPALSEESESKGALSEQRESKDPADPDRSADT
jgi:hypothetical protein